MQTNGSGTLSWAAPTTTGTAWQLTGNTLTGTLPSTPNEWIGTINTADWIIKSNNIERARVFSAGNVGIGTTTTQNKLDVYGDINSAVDTTGYKINNSYVLRHDGNTSDIFVGVDAGNATMTGHSNTAVGNLAGNAVTTGDYNTAVGRQALKLNTTGYWNTACGAGALLLNTTGYANTAMGLNAATACTTSFYTTAIGGNALTNLKNGNYNTAVGYSALQANVSGTDNTATGVSALFSTTGDYNTAVGVNAGYYIAAGDNNTAVGRGAGNAITSGSNNTCVGYGADVTATSSNRGAFGYNAVNNQGNNTIQLGDATCNAIWVATGGSYNISDGRFKSNIKEEVKGLEFINKLRPVTYKVNTRALTEFKTQHMVDSIRGMYLDSTDFTESSSKIHSGFIAQEVLKAITDCGFSSSIVSVPDDSTVSNYGLNYVELVVPLVKAIQELSNRVDSLQTAQKSERKASPSNDNSSGQEDKKTETSIQIELANNVILYQNEPNPFGENTVIRYFVPEGLNQKAYIAFYDSFGKEIKRVQIQQTGYGKISADTQNLTGGVYTYSIIINDVVKDTLKMIKQ